MGCKARKGAHAGSEILPLILLRGSSPRHPTSVRIVEENHCCIPRYVEQLDSVRGCSRGSTLGGELIYRRYCMRIFLWILAALSIVGACHAIAYGQVAEFVVGVGTTAVLLFLLRLDKEERDEY